MRKVPQTKWGKIEYFDKLLQGDEKEAWENFKFVVKVFLGKGLKTLRSL